MLDNLGEVTATSTYDGNAIALTDSNADGMPDSLDASKLTAYTTAAYDDEGRTYQTKTYGVDPSTGTISSTALTSNVFYDPRGNTIASQSSSGRWEKDSYDGVGRMIESAQTDGASGTSYSAAAGVVGDNVLSETLIQYDGDGNTVLTTTLDRLVGNTTTGALSSSDARVSYYASYYDSADRLTKSIDLGINGGSAFTYNPASPPARSSTALTTDYTYDDAGWTDVVTDPKNLQHKTLYDALGRTTTTIADYTDGTPTSNSNQTTSYTYDGDNHTITLTAVMPSGTPSQTTQYVYGVSTSTINSNDLPAQVKYPEPTTGSASSSQAENFSYDAIGEETSYTDRNGTTHVYAYDGLGRMLTDQVTAFGSGVDTSVAKLGYSYGKNGMMQMATSYDASGNVLNQVSRTYDGLGQLASDAQSHGGAVGGTTPTVGYGYDLAHGDRLSSITYPNGRTLNYNYASGVDNSIGRLTSISDSSGTLQSYGYQGLGATLTRTNGNGTQLTITLDNNGRTAERNWTKAGTSLDDLQYAYDNNGNVNSRTDGVISADSESYTYDNLNRLSTFSRGTGTTTASWNLDALGNWTSSTSNGTTTGRTSNAQNQTTAVGTSALAYDANGNTTTDEQGRTLVYNAWNRLVAVKNSGGTTIASYTYDALGNRITETHGGTTTDLYLSSFGQVLEERQGSTATAQNVWSPFYVNELIERDDQPSGGSLTRRVYVLQDANYNVTSLTDASGNVIERYVYDPYGTVTVLNANGTVKGSGAIANSGYGVTYLFQGGRIDATTGMYHFGARDYSPTFGMWVQQDPSQYADGANMYLFLHENPIGFTDSSGLGAVNVFNVTLGQKTHSEGTPDPLSPAPLAWNAVWQKFTVHAQFGNDASKGECAKSIEYRQFVKGFQFGRGFGVPANQEYGFQSDPYIEDVGAVDPVVGIHNHAYGYRSGVNDVLDQYTNPNRATGDTYDAVDVPEIILRSSSPTADPSTTTVQMRLSFKGILIDTAKMASGQFNQTIDGKQYFVLQSKTWLISVDSLATPVTRSPWRPT